jgi:phosphatidylglycerophosphate synthase
VLIVPLAGPDARLFGMSVGDRNIRVARRHGGVVGTLDEHGELFAVIVPPLVAIDAPLFTLESSAPTPVWLESAADQTTRRKAAVLTGPAKALQRYVDDLAAADQLPRRAAPPGAVLDVTTPRARRLSAWEILQRSGKPTDGWVSRTFNRKVSRVVSFAMLSIGLVPAQASVFALLVSIAVAVAAMQPGYLAAVLAGVLFQLASILDGVDGEMARATLTESKQGAKLDATLDQLSYAIGFVGLVIGWIREGAGTFAALWILAVAITAVLSLRRSARFAFRHAPNAPSVEIFVNRTVRRAARDSHGILLRGAAAVFSVLKRDAGAVLILLASLTGSRAVVFAGITLAIVIANATFSLYSRELAAAAATEVTLSRGWGAKRPAAGQTSATFAR